MNASRGADGVDFDHAIEVLEEQTSVLWRRERTTSHALAKNVHPEMEPAAYGILMLLQRARATDGAMTSYLQPGFAALFAAHAFFNLAVVVRTVGGLWEGLDRRREDAAAALGGAVEQVDRAPEQVVEVGFEPGVLQRGD